MKSSVDKFKPNVQPNKYRMKTRTITNCNGGSGRRWLLSFAAKTPMLTAALLLVAGLSNAAASNISGTVTGLPAGRTAQITATSSAGSVTATSALDGTYSVAVADNATYTVRAKAFPLADPSPRSVPVSGADVTGINFALIDGLAAVAQVRRRPSRFVRARQPWFRDGRGRDPCPRARGWRVS